MSVTELLEKNGPLSKVIPGFAPRPPQQEMAEAIEKAIRLEASIIIEAGTGTGKTFGYLVPIFQARKKTILSTGTKNLQDQLYFKDVPIIKQIFSFPIKIVLLKGRANYLCLYRLENSLKDGHFVSRRDVSQLHLINEWATQTQTGDITELTDVSEGPGGIWPHVTSTIDNCLGQECAFYKKCFVVKARACALEADIVIVNHHLFFADLALQEEGFGELLPGADIIVFDEAHHLPDIATQFFSSRLSSRQLLELARDAETECIKDAKDMQSIVDAALDLQTLVPALREQFGPEIRQAPWPQAPDDGLQRSIQSIKKSLEILEGLLKIAAERSKGLENCWRRTVQLIERFDLHTGKPPTDTIHWFETYLQSVTIQLTPMIVANQFRDHLKERKRTWIFTSATLTVKNNFQVFVDALGLNQAIQLQLQSPFDFQKQSLLYVPRHLPSPHATDYVAALVEAIVPVLKASKGRAFILFTSYKALEQASSLLKTQVPYPLLIQGMLPKRQLIDEFVRSGNAILCGTSSFWYGVDVRGDALSCVIIDKLPFASPEGPILKARIQKLRNQGTDPFHHYQLPNAVLILKQGAGRLIRGPEDRGILMICDPRLVGSRYGETFLQSLPNMPRTRDLNKVNEFFIK